MNQLSPSGLAGSQGWLLLAGLAVDGARCRDPAQRWHILGAQQIWLPLSSCSAPFITSPNWHRKEHDIERARHSISVSVLHRVHLYWWKPLLLSHWALSWGRASALVRKVIEFNHMGLKGSGRAGWGLRVKNNTCTLWQWHQNCNPIEGSRKTWMRVAAVGALLISPQKFSPFPPVPARHPGASTCIFVRVALGLLEPPLSLCTAGWKCLWANVPLGSVLNHWLMDVQARVSWLPGARIILSHIFVSLFRVLPWD